MTNFLFKTYNFLFPTLLALAAFAGKFSTKIKASFHLRKDVMHRWQEGMNSIPKESRVWFHVSSVGEIERVKPILEHWHKNSNHTFILSYYSPSAKKMFKNISLVSYADFLPFDDQIDMNRLIKLIQPKMLILDRYDIWPNLIFEAKKENVSIVLINASTPPMGIWGKISITLRKQLFRQVQLWTFVDSIAATAWEPYINDKAEGLVTGNPRFDQALSRAKLAAQNDKIRTELKKQWPSTNNKTIVAGSTWPEDEELLLKALVNIRKQKEYCDVKLMLVPHLTHDDSIRAVIKRCQNYGFSCLRFSDLKNQPQPRESDILIVDILGILAELYGLGITSYVGGGFNKEIHSIIEPAAHHLAIAIGPRFHRSPEAEALILMGGAATFRNTTHGAQKLALWFMNNLVDGELKQRADNALQVFLSLNRGAGVRIAVFLEENFTKNQVQ